MCSGDMAQQLRVLTALPGGLSSVPSHPTPWQFPALNSKSQVIQQNPPRASVDISYIRGAQACAHVGHG